jgi:hypothetical protein
LDSGFSDSSARDLVSRTIEKISRTFSSLAHLFAHPEVSTAELRVAITNRLSTLVRRQGFERVYTSKGFHEWCGKAMNMGRLEITAEQLKHAMHRGESKKSLWKKCCNVSRKQQIWLNQAELKDLLLRLRVQQEEHMSAGHAGSRLVAKREIVLTGDPVGDVGGALSDLQAWHDESGALSRTGTFLLKSE